MGGTSSKTKRGEAPNIATFNLRSLFSKKVHERRGTDVISPSHLRRGTGRKGRQEPEGKYGLLRTPLGEGGPSVRAEPHIQQTSEVYGLGGSDPK